MVDQVISLVAVQVRHLAAAQAFEVKMCRAILLGQDVLIHVHRAPVGGGVLKAAKRALLAQASKLAVDGAFAQKGRSLIIGLTQEGAHLLWNLPVKVTFTVWLLKCLWLQGQ